jgi:hypothetical protein
MGWPVESSRSALYDGGMSVEDLEKAVAKLPPDQFASFREWFEAFASNQWDRQIERDAKNGKLDKLIEESEADFRAGRYREL